MKKSINELLSGYHRFRKEYTNISFSKLSDPYSCEQNPKAMVISCCDSRVDPALLFQCAPGDLFVVRNIANIIPPYEKDSLHHGTSAALEFGIKILKINTLIILGHSQCGGIKTWINSRANNKKLQKNNNVTLEFVDNWVSIIDIENNKNHNVDDYAKLSLVNSYNNCLTFPWIKSKLDNKELDIHLWFFDIETCEILSYDHDNNIYKNVVS
jgi:carbonic anhydrase